MVIPGDELFKLRATKNLSVLLCSEFAGILVCQAVFCSVILCSMCDQCLLLHLVYPPLGGC